MDEYIGTIPVPPVTPSGTFPLLAQYPFVTTIQPDIVEHLFTAASVKRSQRFELGNGQRRWRISQSVTQAEYRVLADFWEAHQGLTYPFTFTVVNYDRTHTSYIAAFEDEPFADSIAGAGGAYVSISVSLREVDTGANIPTYTVNQIDTRFPSAALGQALSLAPQRIIPLVTIKPRLDTYPAITFSDRRVNMAMPSGGPVIYYGARLLQTPEVRQAAAGVPGGTGDTDEATIQAGNADLVFSSLVNAVVLDFARVDIDLFHVDSGILLKLWSGEIARGGISVSGNTCEIRCTDPIANPFIVVPQRTISRTCTAPYSHAPLCPWAGTLDTAHFPSADGSWCDHGYETPNGCLAHNMSRYYRGVPVSPQPFRSKDNSASSFARAFGRSVFTQLSQVSDSAMGQSLPLIFTDGVDIPIKAIIVTGADQGDFYEAVGLIGIGPIGGLSPSYFGNSLDGQSPADFYRNPPHFCAGTEPAGPTDFISLSWNGDQRKGDFRKVYSGNSTFINNTAAGVAFVGFRISDAKGEQITKLDDHDMEVNVRYGLQCWIWASDGGRFSQTSVNPAWIAANVYLWAMGIHEVDSETQKKYIEMNALGTSAWICDWDVTSIIDPSATEVQFQFYGVISDEKPLRDTLADILQNCLGIYTVVAGKLWIDIRVNASAVSAFTDGNLIYQTVKATPPGRQFNRFTANFADRVRDTISNETLFLPNTATAYDQDFAQEMGGGFGGGVVAQYFNGETNLSGTSTISQAQRIANVRLREEVGGVNAAERLSHVEIQGTTTILGLDFCAGQVISVANVAVPSGSVKIRVATWQMTADYRITFQGNTVKNSMYDLVSGPKPADVAPSQIPPEQVALAFRLPWYPNFVGPYPGDPIAPAGMNTFGLQQLYVPRADGGVSAILEVTGERPVNIFLPDTIPPTYRYVSQSTGGSLTPGNTYYMSIIARDANGRYSPPCRVGPVILSAGMSVLVINNIEWPAGAWQRWQLYIGENDERTATLQLESTDMTFTVIGFGGPMQYGLSGAPSPVTTRVLAMAKPARHWGIWGQAINAVSGNVFFFDFLRGTSQSYVGRLFSVVTDRNDYSAGVWNFTVTSEDLSQGALGMSPTPPPGLIEMDDIATPLLMPNLYTDGWNIGDAMVVNVLYPNGMGDDPNLESGLVIRGITPGKPHQVRRAMSNTRDSYAVDRPFDFKPRYYSVEEGGWAFDGTSSISVSNDRAGSNITMQIPIDNLQGLPIVVGAGLEDRYGTKTPEELLQVRFSYLYGAPSPAGGLKSIDVHKRWFKRRPRP